MKRLMMAVVMTLVAAPGAFAASGTWTGRIGDSMCGRSHKASIEHNGGKMTEAQCTEACVKGGAKYVFTSGGKIYAIANQGDKDLAFHAGKAVQITGDMQGSTITVATIVKREKKAKSG
jgi:hypothetical protein